MCFYLVQHMLHQINAQQFYNELDPYQQCCPTENSRIQGFFRALSGFPVLFKADLIFKDFSSKSSKIQVLFKPVRTLFFRRSEQNMNKMFS